MPVRDTLKSKQVPGEQELLDELKTELKAPKQSGEPDIVVERPNSSTVHLYVIWSKWEHLEQMVRSRIILDAYEEAKGKKEAMKVTVAMGLTREEADRLGVK
jgi:hypothetical protein